MQSTGQTVSGESRAKLQSSDFRGPLFDGHHRETPLLENEWQHPWGMTWSVKQEAEAEDSIY